MPGVLAKAPVQHVRIFESLSASEQLPKTSNSQVHLQMAAQVTEQLATTVEENTIPNDKDITSVNRVLFKYFI